MANYQPPKENKAGRWTSPIDVPLDPARGFGMPAPPLTDRGRLHRNTAEWWDLWVQSPQTKFFGGSDWARLIALIPLVDRYNKIVDTYRFVAVIPPSKLTEVAASKEKHAMALWGQAAKLLSEIRLNEGCLGGTHVDRLRGRMKTDQPVTEAPRVEDGRATARDFRGRLRSVPSPGSKIG